MIVSVYYEVNTFPHIRSAIVFKLLRSVLHSADIMHLLTLAVPTIADTYINDCTLASVNILNAESKRNIVKWKIICIFVITLSDTESRTSF